MNTNRHSKSTKYGVLRLTSRLIHPIPRFLLPALAYLLLPTSYFLLSSTASAVDVDGIVATVGNENILRSEVVGEMQRFRMGPDADFNTVRNELIDRKLILKAAKSAKMTMQEWVVDNRIREIIDGNFGGDRNRLVAALALEKTSFPEFRQRIKDDLIVGAMRWNMVDKFLSAASPAEMQDEYAAHPDRYMDKAKVSVSVILMKSDDAEGKASVDEALKTDDFASVARRYSADTLHAKDGGLWKDVDANEVFRPEIRDALAKLAKGEVSSWIDLDGWSFLLRKEDEKPALVRSFAEAYDDIESNVRDARRKVLYDRWLEILRAETYIKTY